MPNGDKKGSSFWQGLFGPLGGAAEWWEKPKDTDIFGRYPAPDIRTQRTMALEQTPEYQEQRSLQQIGGVPLGPDVQAAKEAMEGVFGQYGLEQPTGRTIIKNGYIVPIFTRADGTEYENWSEAIPEREAAGAPGVMSEAERKKFELQETEARREQWRYAAEQGEERQYRDWQKEEAERTRAFEQQEFESRETYRQQQMEQQQMQHEEMLGWYRQQQEASLAAQREQQLAQLRANPSSWLEYASLAGETPVIQPWMQPLGQQHDMQAGQPIPGYQAGGETMNLPELTTPSAQYMSRLSPSMQAQYGGYEQARTGQTPADIDWQRWQQSPPGGSFPGIRRLR